jgi:hypothetical protein
MLSTNPIKYLSSIMVRSIHHFQKVKSYFYKHYNTIHTKKRQVNTAFIPENSVHGYIYKCYI